MIRVLLFLLLCFPSIGALKFTAADSQQVNVNGILSYISSNTTGTIGANVYLNPNGALQTILSLGDTDANEYFVLLIDAGGRLQGTCVDAGTVQWVIRSNDSLSVGYHCIYLTHNGTTPALYDSGNALNVTFVNQTNKAIWLNSLSGLDNARIGVLTYNNIKGAGYYNQYIWDVRYYHRVLSVPEMKLICVSQGIDRIYTISDSCYARWALDEFSTGASVADGSGRGNTGTPVNSPTYVGAPVRR